jgi:polyferredoxin
MEPTSENNGCTGCGVCLSSVDIILFESDLIR